MSAPPVIQTADLNRRTAAIPATNLGNDPMVQVVVQGSVDPATGVVTVDTGSEGGPSDSAAAAIVPVVTNALATGKVIKNSPGNLYGLNVAATTVGGWILVHDAVAVPGAGAVTPVAAYPVSIGQAIDVEFDPPLRCAVGISVSFSSAATPFTQTNSATAFISGRAV